MRLVPGPDDELWKKLCLSLSDGRENPVDLRSDSQKLALARLSEELMCQ